MINMYAVIMLTSAFLASVSQILLKLSANKKYRNPILEYFNPYVILGYGILMLTMLMNVYAYRGLDYKIGPIIASTSYLFVMVLGKLILKESVTKNKVLGIAIILIGIYIFNI